MNVIVIPCDTLRRDHVSTYTGGKPLNPCWSEEAPDWSGQTPNMDRLAARGYDVPGVGARAWYAPWRDKHTQEQFHNLRAPGEQLERLGLDEVI